MLRLGPDMCSTILFTMSRGLLLIKNILLAAFQHNFLLYKYKTFFHPQGRNILYHNFLATIVYTEKGTSIKKLACKSLPRNITSLPSFELNFLLFCPIHRNEDSASKCKIIWCSSPDKIFHFHHFLSPKSFFDFLCFPAAEYQSNKCSNFNPILWPNISFSLDIVFLIVPMYWFVNSIIISNISSDCSLNQQHY